MTGTRALTPVCPVVLVGHPRPASRTHAVATRAGRLLVEALADDGLPLRQPRLVDLAELGAHLLTDPPGAGRAGAAIDTVRSTPLLVVASPTFRGAYTGLLKLFLDALPRYGLDRVVAVPLMTAGLRRHRDAVDSVLRPLLCELRAWVPDAGIGVLEEELGRFDDIFARWWLTHGRQVRAGIRAWSGGLRQEVGSC